MLNKLRKNCNDELRKEERKKKFIQELVKKNLNKRNGAFSEILNEIKEAKNQEKDLKQRQKIALNNLCKKQKAKQIETLNRLRANR